MPNYDDSDFFSSANSNLVQPQKSAEDNANDDLDFFKGARTDANTLIPLAVEAGGNKSAEESIQDKAFQEKHGVSISQIGELDPARAEVCKFLKTTPEDFASTYPRLANAFSNPYILSIAKEDAQSLMNIENGLKLLENQKKVSDQVVGEQSETVDEEGATSGWAENDVRDVGPNVIGATVKQGASQLVGGLFNAAISAIDVAGGDSGTLKSYKKTFEKMRDKADSWGEDFSTMNKEWNWLERNLAGGASSGVMMSLTYGAGFALAAGLMASGIGAPAAMALMGKLSLGLMAMSAYGQAYNEGRKKGLSVGEAVGHGAWQGGWEYITERMNIKAVKDLYFANKPMLRDIANFMKREVGTEELNSFMQGIEKSFVMPDQTVAEFLKPANLLNMVAETAVQTVVGAGVQTGTARGLHAIVSSDTLQLGGAMIELAKTQENVNLLRSMADYAQNSALAQRAPEQLAKVVAEVTKNDTPWAYVSHEALTPAIRDRIRAVDPNLDEAITKAVTLQEDLAMPIEAFAQIINDEAVVETLNDNVKFDQNGITVSEAKQNLAVIAEQSKAEVERLIEEQKKSANGTSETQQIIDDLTPILRDTGTIIGQTAKDQAVLWGKFFTRLSGQFEKAGKTVSPMELYKKYRSKIVGPDTEMVRMDTFNRMSKASRGLASLLSEFDKKVTEKGSKWGQVQWLKERVTEAVKTLPEGNEMRTQLENIKSRNSDEYRNKVEAILKSAQAEIQANTFNQRISTAIIGPAAVKKGVPDSRFVRRWASLKDLMQNTKQFEKNLEFIRRLPGMKTIVKGMRNKERIAENVINRMADNLLFLYNKVPDSVRSRTRLWYDGGRKTAQEWATRYGLRVRQTAALIALYSPSNNWYNNLTMAERTLDIYFAHGDEIPNKKTLSRAKAIAGNKYGDLNEKTIKGLCEEGNMEGAACLLRAWDEVNNSNKLYVQTPEGGRGGYFSNPRAWMASIPRIADAISVIRDGSIDNVSRVIGTEFKVRNFYNNLYDPTNPYAATIDTHQVGASLLRVMAGQDIEVAQNFGTAPGVVNSAVTGQKGTYAFYFEALQRAAQRAGVLPREMQSITWEAIRAMFPSKLKKAMRPDVDAIWKRVDSEEITAEEARDLIFKLAIEKNKELGVKLNESGLPFTAWQDTPYNDTVQETYDRGNVNLGNIVQPEPEPTLSIEVAPATDNSEQSVKARKTWETLTDEEKQKVTMRVLPTIIEKVAAETKTYVSEPSMQLGGWLGSTNYSMVCSVADGGDYVRVAKRLAEVLHQDAVFTISTQKAEGTDPCKVIRIVLPNGFTEAQIKDLYENYIDKVLDDSGERLISGMSASNGIMTFGVDSSRINEIQQKLADILSSHPEEEFSVDVVDAFMGEIKGNKNGENSLDDTGREQGVQQEKPVENNANLQQEADELLAKTIEEVKSERTSKADSFAQRVSNILPQAVRDAMKQIAYHGSPFKFDKFTLSHIGEGEGAQAHGWGLYFTLNKGIARKYRKVLSFSKINPNDYDLTWDGEAVDHQTDVVHHAVDRLLLMTIGIPENLEKASPEEIRDALDAIKKKSEDTDNDPDFRNMDEDEYEDEIKRLNYLYKNAEKLNIGVSFEAKKHYANIKIGNEEFTKVSYTISDKRGRDPAMYKQDALREAFDTGAATKEEILDILRRRNENGRFDRAINWIESSDGYEYTPYSEEKPSIENSGSFYTVDIPNDDVMLREWESIEKQPSVVRDAYSEFMRVLDEDLKSGDKQRIDRANESKKHLYSRIDGEQFYVSLGYYLGGKNRWKSASRWLNKHGVKGIRYSGDMDGECAVVWDEDSIKILDFFENNPEKLMEAKGEANVGAERGDIAGWWSKSSNTLGLTKHTNITTFAHESGHMFLNIYFEIARDADAPQSIKRDVATLLDWFGLKDLQQYFDLEAKGPDFVREYHEKFARGFEAYLREGKAPSKGLEDIFYKFKRWITDWYKDKTDKETIDNAQSDLTADVRAVMARMLASEEEIDRENKIRSFANLWQDRKNFPGNDEQYLDYIKLVKDSDLEARAMLTAAYMEELEFMTERKTVIMAELANQYNEEYNDAYEDAKERLLSNPLYKALERITKDEEAVSLKIATSEVSTLPENTVARLNALGVLSDDGMPLDAVAKQLGFEDPVEFINGMSKLQPLEQKAREMAEAQMTVDNEDIMTREGRDAVATAAVMNELAMKRAEKEYAIVKATKKTPELVSAATLDAEEAFGSMRLGSVKTGHYKQKANKASQNAVAAAAKGDTQAAADAKKAEVFSMAKAKKAADIINRKEKLVKLALRMKRKAKKLAQRRQLDSQFIDQVLSLMSHYTTRRNGKTVILGIENPSRRSFDEFKKSWTEKGVPLDAIDDTLFSGIKDIDDMTVDQFETLADAVSILVTQGRRVSQISKENYKVNLQNTVDECVLEIESSSKEIPPSVSMKSDYKKFMTEALLSHRKFSSLIYELGGFKYGKLAEVTLTRLNNAAAREATMTQEFAKKYWDLVKGLKNLNEKAEVKQIHNANGSVRSEMIKKRERIAIALNSGNKENMQRLEVDGFDQITIYNVFSTLSEEEIKFVQDVWDLIDQFWKPLADLELRTNGLEPKKVLPVPITVMSKNQKRIELKGGYYPIKYDKSKNPESVKQEIQDYAASLFRGAVTSSATKQGHTKVREQNTDLHLLLDPDVIGIHAQQVIHDLCYREALQDINKLFRDEKLKNSIKSRKGAEWVSELSNALIDIAADGATGALLHDGVAKALGYFRGTLSASVMGLSVTTTLLQPLGLIQSAARLGSKAVLSGTLHAMKDRKSCYEMSEMMRNRRMTMNVEIREVGRALSRTNNPKWSKRYTDYKKAIFTPMMAMQQIVDVPTWYGAYDMARAEGKSEQDAIAFADQTVLDTQGSGDIKDMSRVHKNHPLLTMFYSYFSATYQLAVESGKKNAAKGALGATLFARDIIMLLAVPNLVTALFFGFMRGSEPPEDAEGWLLFALKEFGSSVLNMFVLARELVPVFEAAVQIVNGGSAPSYTGPAVARVIPDMTKLVMAMGGDKDAFDKIMAAIPFVGDVTGIPTTQLARSLKGAKAYIEGETDMPTAVLFGKPTKEY